MNVVLLGIGIFGIGIIIFALMLLLRGDGAREQKLMQYFLLGALVQNAGYLLELTAPSMEAAVVSVKMQYLGSLTIPISYCHFMFRYCHARTPKKVLAVLEMIDVFILFLVFTCDLHQFYYRDIQWLTDANGHGYLRLQYGPGYWIFMLCGTIVPYVLSLYALISVCIRKPEYAADRRCRLILVLSFLPVGALYAYSMKLTRAYDPTPVVLGLVLSSVVILIWSRKVYDFSSLAFGILVNSMSDGVIALDEQRQITNYNPAAAGIFTDLAHMTGEPVEMLNGFPKDMLGEEAKREFCLNDRFYQGHVEPILDEFGKNKGYVVLFFDVTETRNYIEEIKRVREQAEQANIAKSAFLANMSHEIRTPMNAIVGLSDIIMEESRGRKVYEYACDIKSASRNLLSLINDILDLSKVEAGKMELVPVAYHVKSLVGEVMNMMDVVASQRGLRLKQDFDMSIPSRYLGDDGRIRQILINILNNALKFTRKGHVALSVTGTRGDTQDTEWLVFRIEDTGCGIREEDLKTIFENFQQVDSKRNRTVEGTGLGLSITKRLVELMQGTVHVESVYGEGTVFTVKIPQKIMDYRTLSENPEEETRKEEEIQPFTADGCRVLVVDDNRINRKIATIFLQSYGMEIDEADSGTAAIALVRKKCYDIIFMDHMMPDVDGVETTRVIRRLLGENGQVPIIALTANAVDGVREMFLSEGMNDLVTKPIEVRTLVAKLKKWLPPEKVLKQSGMRKNGERHEASISIEGLDVQEAMRLVGNETLFWAVLKEYYRVIDKKYGMIGEYERQEKWKEYTIEVHALKSASRQIGAMELAAVAEQMEAAGNAKDALLIHETTPKMLEQYIRYKEILAPYFPEKEKEQTVGEAGKDQIEEFFVQLKEAMDNLDMDAMEEVIRKMSKYSYAGEQKDCFDRLCNAVADIDTEKCEVIMMDWVEKLSLEKL